MVRTAFIFCVLMLLAGSFAFAQEADTMKKEAVNNNLHNDTSDKATNQLQQAGEAQVIRERVNPKNDSTVNMQQGIPEADVNSDSLPTVVPTRAAVRNEHVLQDALAQNRFINVDQPPVLFVQEIRTVQNNKDIFFYIMCGILLILGLFRMFYSHYFSTLFTVYFNTSLRQTQLSEQLLQARQPSFILNIFFVFVSGLYVWLLFMNTQEGMNRSPYLFFQMFVGIIGLIYLIKFSFLKFLGWISGLGDTINHYIFIIFLVNKLLAIILIPFVILMAFGKKEWMSIYITLSLLCVGVLFLSRYIKSYGLLRQKFPMTFFHFLLFFLGAELVPLFLIFKIIKEYIIV